LQQEKLRHYQKYHINFICVGRDNLPDIAAFVKNIESQALDRLLGLHPLKLEELISLKRESLTRTGSKYVFAPNRWQIGLPEQDFKVYKDLIPQLQPIFQEHFIQPQDFFRELILEFIPAAEVQVQAGFWGSLPDGQTGDVAALWEGLEGWLAQRIILLGRDAYTMGRNQENDIIIPDAKVSRRHAQVAWEGDRLRYQDLNSTFGTWIEGEKIISMILPDEALVKLGDSSFMMWYLRT
jgi:hypothetical protein